jgi:hypothetical protein
LEGGFLMAEDAPKKTILGYVSAYLNQTLRELVEAERDYRLEHGQTETSEPAVACDSRPNSAAPRSFKTGK